MELVYPDLFLSLKSREEEGWSKVGKKNQKVTIFDHWVQSGENTKTNRSIDVLLQMDDVWGMSRVERQRIVEEITKSIIDEDLREISLLETQLAKVNADLQDHYDASKLEALKDIQVIGITTSGASKFLNLLQRLGPKIIVCEEASEILESHMLTLLHSSVQHVISIGDHLQLRPKIAQYDLSLENPRGKFYSLDLSQFERLQLDDYKFPLNMLLTQRRMRPEISRLVRETIYPNLKDGSVVENYANVRGISTNTFFINHCMPEDAEGSSRSNKFEAEYIVALLQYLLHQGYPAKDITILTPYLGQLRLLRRLLGKVTMLLLSDRDAEELGELENEIDIVNPVSKYQQSAEIEKLDSCVRIATVDNFQGGKSIYIGIFY